MAWVRTFRIDNRHGTPDKEMREWITGCEAKAIVAVNTTFIPSKTEGIDDRICVVVTKLDDL